jgi:predicted outer membrane protein
MDIIDQEALDRILNRLLKEFEPTDNMKASTARDYLILTLKKHIGNRFDGKHVAERISKHLESVGLKE